MVSQPAATEQLARTIGLALADWALEDPDYPWGRALREILEDRALLHTLAESFRDEICDCGCRKPWRDRACATCEGVAHELQHYREEPWSA